MEILILSHEYPPLGGGGANACLNLTREYAEKGHQVTILTVWYPGRKEEEQIGGVRLIRLKAKRKHVEHCGFPEMLDYLRLALAKADYLCKRERFDICQVFFAIPSGPVGYYLKKRYKIPYIIRFGGGDIPGFQERFQLLYKLIGPFEKPIWHSADALVANSAGLRKLAQAFDNRREIKIITNGVNIDWMQEKPADREKDALETSDEIRLLFVSRLIQRKGLQHVIPMLRTINEQVGKRVSLTIVGDGPYRMELERITKESHAKELVVFAGQKEKQELPAYYQTADIFILPSKKEGMPNVVLEAMASGLPIVMTPCEGSEELIHGNGYVVSLEEFTEVLVKLCHEESLRKAMGEKSKALVQERFRWSGIAEQYLQLMGEICEGSRKKASNLVEE